MDDAPVLLANLPDESPYLSVLKASCEELGHRFVPIDAVEELEPLFAEELRLLVIDYRHEASIPILTRLKSDRFHGRTPVLAIFPEDVDPERDPSFMIAPEVTLTEPLETEEVPEAVRRLLNFRDSHSIRFHQDIHLRVRTEPDSIDRACSFFERLIATAGYDEQDQVALGASFREAVGNAAEHGNENCPDKLIRIDYFLDGEKVAFGIRDEGDGFDHESYVQKATAESALQTTRGRRDTEARPGGLGFHIMRQTCDRFFYNDRGNGLYLMKYLPGRDGNGQ